MSKLIDKLQSAERERKNLAERESNGDKPAAERRKAPRTPESVDDLRGRIEVEKMAEESAQGRAGEEKRSLDLARERQAAEVELRRIAHARAEAETKAARLISERERAEAQALAE